MCVITWPGVSVGDKCYHCLTLSARRQLTAAHDWVHWLSLTGSLDALRLLDGWLAGWMAGCLAGWVAG